MSRKTLLTVFAVLGAIAAAIGLGSAGPALGGLAAIVVYVLFEAKADIAAVKAQSGRFKDPKFLITLVSAVLAALASSGVTLPIDSNVIVAILTAIVGILFKATTPLTPAVPLPPATPKV